MKCRDRFQNRHQIHLQIQDRARHQQMKNDMEKMVCHHVVDQFRERLVVVVLLQNLDEQNQDAHQSSLVLVDVVLVLNVAVHFRERQV